MKLELAMLAALFDLDERATLLAALNRHIVFLRLAGAGAAEPMLSDILQSELEIAERLLARLTTGFAIAPAGDETEPDNNPPAEDATPTVEPEASFADWTERVITLRCIRDGNAETFDEEIAAEVCGTLAIAVFVTKSRKVVSLTHIPTGLMMAEARLLLNARTDREKGNLKALAAQLYEVLPADDPRWQAQRDNAAAMKQLRDAIAPTLRDWAKRAKVRR